MEAGSRPSGSVTSRKEKARTFRTAASTSHPGSKKGYRHHTVTPGRGRNAARAATSIRRSAPRLYLPSRPPARPRYQRPSNG
jgi:hypothetical protein